MTKEQLIEEIEKGENLIWYDGQWLGEWDKENNTFLSYDTEYQADEIDMDYIRVIETEELEWHNLEEYMTLAKKFKYSDEWDTPKFTWTVSDDFTNPGLDYELLIDTEILRRIEQIQFHKCKVKKIK